MCFSVLVGGKLSAFRILCHQKFIFVVFCYYFFNRMKLPHVMLKFQINADKNVEYEVTVQGVEISPYPVVRGQPATFSISANTGNIECLCDFFDFSRICSTFNSKFVIFCFLSFIAMMMMANFSYSIFHRFIHIFALN